MQDIRFVSRDYARRPGAYLMLAVTLVTIGSSGCSADGPDPTQPIAVASGIGNSNVHDASAIIVSNSAELAAALAPVNAGRHIRVLAGNYSLTQPLTVPDAATLEGEGVMLFDGSGLPAGFSAGTRTTLTMTVNTPGDVLTLGNDATVRGLAIQDLAGRIGNAIGVVSRSAGDQVLATIEEIEVINPTTHTVAPSGPSGCGVAIVTRNPNLGGDPPPHAGAAIASRISRSLIRSGATGAACGLFAFNFAPVASVSVTLVDNVVGGGIIVNGGVSRPDVVHDSRTEIQSQHNLYRNDSPNLCVPQRLGWSAHGGSGLPAPLAIGGTRGNMLLIHSVDDRIEGFTTGVSATGGRRFFAAPIAGPTTGNSVDLQLIGTFVATPSCGAAPVADFRLAGAIAAGSSLTPGDSNTVRAVLRGVTGSGSRSNVYANATGSTGTLSPALQGSGNRLEIAGNLQAFGQTNRAIDPAPGPEFFTSNGNK